MKASAQAIAGQDSGFICGLFSKMEAARIIAGGVRHVHSSTLGYRDAYARITEAYLKNTMTELYPWEHPKSADSFVLGSSHERHGRVEKAIESMGIELDRKLRDRVNCVLEELITNAIYHSHKREDGSLKYARQDKVELGQGEKVAVKYRYIENGVYLSVEDHCGTLAWENIINSFHRCYKKSSDQILTKESGAGLGFYMVFELSTHVKINVWNGKKTEISCWLSDKRTYDPDLFSFNYYERG